MQDGLPDLPVTRVYVDPRDPAGNTVYAATHVGVYRTVNGGENWESFSNGLPTVRVNDIYMPPDGGFMRIATYGRGIWELSQIELVDTTLADEGSVVRSGRRARQRRNRQPGRHVQEPGSEQPESRRADRHVE